MLNPITKFLNSYNEEYILVKHNRRNEYKCYRYATGKLTNDSVPKKRAEELFFERTWKEVCD